jgi:chromosome segregation ATPase
MSEERRKMAWQLVLAVAGSGVNPDSEWSAKKAWGVVDSFLENEGKAELPDHDGMRLNAVNRMNTLLHDENKELTKERDELKVFKKGALDDIERLVAKIALQKDDYSELKAKLDEFMSTEVGQVTQEKLSLEFRCQSLEADLNRTIDELNTESCLAKQEYEGALKAADYWKNNYDDLADKVKQVTEERDGLNTENEKLTKQLDEATTGAKAWKQKYFAACEEKLRLAKGENQ